MADRPDALFLPLQLPCGVVLKNRIIKSAMSDSLGNGSGDATDAQAQLYRAWADGGVAASIVGEVQGDPHAAEKPGNLVLGSSSDRRKMQALATAGAENGGQLWLQLGHAGAMAHPPISTPKGPSALHLPGLTCEALTTEEIAALPHMFAQTAALAQKMGFHGVQVHAAHGFLLSQFLSPLFNHRMDDYGGSIEGRTRLLLETITAVRDAVGPTFPIAVKLNSTDMLEGGLADDDALKVVASLTETSIDLLDISGGTYFPGAAAASDGSGRGPYFVDFARRARAVTHKPLMVTGGFKTKAQATDAIDSGAADFIGLARALVLVPDLPRRWLANTETTPAFPKFDNPPEGGVTAWYTMRITQIGEGREDQAPLNVTEAMRAYDERDELRTKTWNAAFPQ